MKVLVAGSHGMIGSAVVPRLIECGHQVTRLVRSTPGPGEVWWDPDAGKIDAAGLEGFDGVVNTATVKWPLRWTAKSKQTVLANRLATNGLLASTLAACARPPRVLVCASGMGYYAPAGDDLLTEDCPAGTTFLAQFDQQAEDSTSIASRAGIRVVHLRIPMVLGGAMLQFLGFQAGEGQQWMSWVVLDELAYIIEFALSCESLSGPVNAVSPKPLRNAEFAAASTRALGQKSGGTMPAFFLRIFMGEFGAEIYLASRRIQPAKLLDAGYQFRFPDLADALHHEKERAEAAVAAKASQESAAVRT